MAKSILKRLVILLCIFVGCLIAFSIQINRKEVTYAAPVTGASLPMAYMQVEGMTVNPMTPYRQELQEAFERECLTPLSVDRSLTLLIDPKENSVKGVSYQVTSLEDGSMMENGQLTEMEDAGGMLALRFRLTTTELHNEQEYMLRFAVDIGKGGTLYYYTRLMQYGAGNIGSYLSFTNSFIESATDKVAAADLAIYMEPDNTEPNRSLAHITITSSTELLSWSSLHPQIVMRMPPTIQEINDINAGIRQQYVIMATDEDLNEEYYTVDEYFRVTEYSGMLIVRNYQRDCAQIFDGSLPVVGESALNLGIQPRDLEYVENQDSTKAAFAVNGDLWLYDTMTDKLTQIFTFRRKTAEEKPKPDLDGRTEFARHAVSIGEITPAGDITFLVYGYMPSGAHEGLTGVSVCRYSAESNAVEETMFLPLDQSIDFLMRNVSKLSFISGDAMYLFLGSQLCRVDLSDGGFSVEEEGIAEDALFVSDTQRQIAWTDSTDGGPGTKMTVLNLATGARRTIQAPGGQKIVGCGFIGEDIGYGLVREEDILGRTDGTVVCGMYLIRIEGENGEIRKEYQKDAVYVTQAAVNGSNMQLDLATRTGNRFQEAGTDQIRNNELKEDRVQLLPIAAKRTDEQMWLTFADILLKTDPEVLTAGYSGERGEVQTILESPENEQEQYYIYGYGKLQDIETRRKTAIVKAYECAGAALDEKQRYIWQRYDWPVTYRIDLNTMTPGILNAGSSGDPAAFEAALDSGSELLDVSGTMTTGMFYWISRGRPVFGKIPDGGSYLLVGYDEDNVLVWDPATGGTQEIRRGKADKLFRQMGYVFYTYQEKQADPLPEEEQ